MNKQRLVLIKVAFADYIKEEDIDTAVENFRRVINRIGRAKIYPIGTIGDVKNIKYEVCLKATGKRDVLLQFVDSRFICSINNAVVYTSYATIIENKKENCQPEIKLISIESAAFGKEGKFIQEVFTNIDIIHIEKTHYVTGYIYSEHVVFLNQMIKVYFKPKKVNGKVIEGDERFKPFNSL